MILILHLFILIAIIYLRANLNGVSPCRDKKIGFLPYYIESMPWFSKNVKFYNILQLRKLLDHRYQGFAERQRYSEDSVQTAAQRPA